MTWRHPAITWDWGHGIGWRPELAQYIEKRNDSGFLEITAENWNPEHLPRPLLKQMEKGVPIIPHAISLSLGSTEPVDQKRIDDLARLAERVDAPLVSEHISFVRSEEIEAGHLTPIPRTEEQLEAILANIERVKKTIQIPFALENISQLFDWPERDMTDGIFVRRIAEESDSLLLLDIANVYANAHNIEVDPVEFLKEIPLGRVAYLHVGGGFIAGNGIYHDTHSHDVRPEITDLLKQYCELSKPPGYMIERDDNFPAPEKMDQEIGKLIDSVKSVHA